MMTWERRCNCVRGPAAYKHQLRNGQQHDRHSEENVHGLNVPPGEGNGNGCLQQGPNGRVGHQWLSQPQIVEVGSKARRANTLTVRQVQTHNEHSHSHHPEQQVSGAGLCSHAQQVDDGSE